MDKCQYTLPPDRYWSRPRACYYNGRHTVDGLPYCKTHAAIVARQLNTETPEQVKADRDSLRDQIAALTAQNEALRAALANGHHQYTFLDGRFSVTKCYSDCEACSALSITPAEALERAKRDAEERRLLNGFYDHIKYEVETGFIGPIHVSDATRHQIETIDNFRKGAGR